jgi:DcaP outer membrane protein
MTRFLGEHTMRHISLIFAILLLVPGLSDAQELALGRPSTVRALSTVPSAPPDDQTAQPKVVEEGLFPASFKIPGTEVSLAIGGYIKVDFIQDFKAIGNVDDFQVNSIPASGTAAAAQSGQTNIHARETRFNIDVRSDSPAGKFRAFAEGDFYGTGNAFRLRHGYGEIGPLLGGQTWTTFMDISARPLTIDFEGPDSEVFVRQAMIRFTRSLSSNWTLAIAAEDPTPQFAVPSELAGSARSNFPDLPGYLRYQKPRGHFQLAGIVRQLRFDPSDGDESEWIMGGGFNGTFSVTTFGKDTLQGQFMIVDGTARYIESFSGQNVDAVLSATGDLSALRSQAGVVGYTHHWNETVRSGIAFSTASLETNAALSASTIERTQDFRANLLWSPYRLVDIGGEVLWGRRDNQDGSHGDNWRFQFTTIYRLH